MPTYIVHTVCNINIERETWRITSATPLTDETIEAAVRGTIPADVTVVRSDIETNGTDRTIVAIEEAGDDRCPSTLGALRCELPTGHGRYHKHNAAGWEDA